MQELRQSTQVLAVIGPVVAVGDGFTPVTTLDLSTADEAEILKHNTSSVTSIAAATFAAVTSADGYYVLTLTTSLTDTLGMLTVLVNDDSLCLPVKAQFMVLSAFEWDRKYSAQSMQLSGVTGYGTAQSASATGLVVASGAAYEDNILVGQTVTAAGTDEGAVQARAITANDESDDSLTVDTWTDTPSGAPILYAIFSSPPGSITSPAPVNVVQVSGDATAADTLELFAESLDQSTGQLDSGSLANGTITAASIASDAITDAKVASDVTIASVTGAVGSVTGAVGSVTGAVGSVTGNVGGNVTGSVGSIATGGIAAASFAAGAIDAAAIAANAIGASELAADAVAEIADAVWDEATTSHTTSGTFGEQLKTDVDAILADTDVIGTPSNLGGGATVAANLSDIESQTDDIGVAGAGLTAADDAVLAAIAALNNLSQANVRTAVGLASANLDTQLDALPTAVENADALLGRNIAGGSSTGRTVTSALRKIRNKVAIADGTLTVYQEDDTTTDHTATVTTAAGNPIASVDPS